MLSVLPACADKGFCEAASSGFYSGSSTSFGGSSGYGGSSSASSSISADLSALISSPDGGSHSVDVAGAKQSISGNLASITLADQPTAGGSLTANLNALISSAPDTSPALPSIGKIGGRISAGFSSLAGGSSAPSGSGGSPSVSSPCPGVSVSSLPASAATYAAVHG